MSLFTNLGRTKPKEITVALPVECQHWELAPRWDSAADMGRPDRVTYYACTACGKAVSREDAKARAS